MVDRIGDRCVQGALGASSQRVRADRVARASARRSCATSSWPATPDAASGRCRSSSSSPSTRSSSSRRRPCDSPAYCGLVIASLGFLYAAVLVISAVMFESAPEGWTSVMVAVLIVGGLQLAILGVLGEYIWRGTDEARRRPLYVVRSETSPPNRRRARSSPSGRMPRRRRDVAPTARLNPAASVGRRGVACQAAARDAGHRRRGDQLAHDEGRQRPLRRDDRHGHRRRGHDQRPGPAPRERVRRDRLRRTACVSDQVRRSERRAARDQRRRDRADGGRVAEREPEQIGSRASAASAAAGRAARRPTTNTRVAIGATAPGPSRSTRSRSGRSVRAARGRMRNIGARNAVVATPRAATSADDAPRSPAASGGATSNTFATSGTARRGRRNRLGGAGLRHRRTRLGGAKEGHGGKGARAGSWRRSGGASAETSAIPAQSCGAQSGIEGGDGAIAA